MAYFTSTPKNLTSFADSHLTASEARPNLCWQAAYTIQGGARPRILALV